MVRISGSSSGNTVGLGRLPKNRVVAGARVVTGSSSGGDVVKTRTFVRVLVGTLSRGRRNG